MPEIELRLPHVRLRALTWGADDGPLALLLHGFPDTAHTWRHLGPALADDGFRVVAPFTRGYAPSGLADDGRYDVGALMADAVGIHTLLGGGEAVLVGHDWGALTADALAAHRDSPFARVVSMAVPPVPAMRSVPRRRLPRQALRSWYIGFNQLPLLPEALTPALVERLWQAWSPGYDASTDLTHVHAALSGRPHRTAALRYYRHLARPFRVPGEYRRWQASLSDPPSVPFLYLHGRDDGCLGLGLTDGVADRHVVDGAGHFLHLERPESVGRLVRDFLRTS